MPGAVVVWTWLCARAVSRAFFFPSVIELGSCFALWVFFSAA